MTITTNKKLCTSLLITAALGTSMNMAWAAESLEERIQTLENKLAAKSELQSDNAMSAKFYATVRPSLTYFDKGDENKVEVTDHLSFLGIYSDADVGNGWTAIAHGEWGFDISGDAEFGKARRSSVALSHDTYGKIAIGKDRAVDYLLHGTNVDIFNHRGSPFGYDQKGPDAFFVNNQVTYANTWDSITLMAGVKYSGNRVGEDNTNYGEQSIIGLGYDANDLHLAASYKSRDTGAGEDVDTVAVSYAQQITDDFYLAALYQDIEEADSLDIVMGYQLNNKYKVKAGYYDFDTGVSMSTDNVNGFNVTLERQHTPKFRTFVEVLTKDFDNGEDEVALTIGLKYDLAALWKS